MTSEVPRTILLTAQEDHLTSAFAIINVITSVPKQFVCRSRSQDIRLPESPDNIQLHGSVCADGLYVAQC